MSNDAGRAWAGAASARGRLPVRERDLVHPPPTAPSKHQPARVDEHAIGPRRERLDRAQSGQLPPERHERLLERVGHAGRIAQIAVAIRVTATCRSSISATNASASPRRACSTSRSDTPPPCRSPQLTPSEYEGGLAVHFGPRPRQSIDSRGVPIHSLGYIHGCWCSCVDVTVE